MAVGVVEENVAGYSGFVALRFDDENAGKSVVPRIFSDDTDSDTDDTDYSSSSDTDDTDEIVFAPKFAFKLKSVSSRAIVDDDRPFDFELLAHEPSGFFNATRLCQLGGKKYETYAGLKRCDDLDELLRAKVGARLSLSAKKLKLESKAAVHGVYVHPLKLLDVAGWLSTELYVKCAVAANAFFARTPQRGRLLRATLKSGDGDSGDVVVDKRLRLRSILCAGGDELLMDERGLINASRLCTVGRPFELFDEERGAGQLRCLRRYVDEVRRRRGQVGSTEPTHGVYVHPIAAIGVLLWRSPNAYARLAAVILWRLCKATAEAAAGKRKLEAFMADVSADAEDGPSHVSCDASASAAFTPSTSKASVASTSRRDDRPRVTSQPTRISFLSSGATASAASIPSTSEASVASTTHRDDRPRVISQPTRKPREGGDEDDAERPKKRARAEEAETERLKRELALGRGLQSRRIDELMRRDGVAALECVLVARLRTAPSTLYAFHRRFRGLASAVLEKRHDVADFAFWYATDHSAIHFEEAKKAAVRVVASYARVRLATTRNEIRVVAQAEDKGPSVAAVVTRVTTEMDGVLRALGLLELDVKVLRTLFRDDRPDGVEALARNAKSDTERRVYEWLRDEYLKKRTA